MRIEWKVKSLGPGCMVTWDLLHGGNYVGSVHRWRDSSVTAGRRAECTAPGARGKVIDAYNITLQEAATVLVRTLGLEGFLV